MLGRDNTYATNPGGIKVDLLRTMRWDWWLFALAAVVAVGAFFFGLLVVKKNGVTYGVPFACLAAPFMMQMQNNRRFQSGALIPGYVVQADPCLVAALSDMGTGKDDREYHQVIILPVPLAKYTGAPVTVGQAAPLCSLYHTQSITAPLHWDRMDAESVHKVTGNPAAVEDAADRVEDRELLKAAIPRLPQPFKAGQYRVDLSDLTGGECGWTADELKRRV